MLTSLFMLAQLQDQPAAGPLGALFGGAFMLVWLAVMVLIVAGFWKVFVKAGEPGWASIIPIYNCIVLLKIAGRPLWWFLLLLVPVVNLVIFIVVSLDVARRFGQGAGYGVGLAVLPMIFYPMLGFGSARYTG